MNKYKLILKLLSDALPGNGEGLAGIIDNDVCFDEYGLPFIPARRIKGILREVADQLRHFSGVTGITEELFSMLFQNSGCAEEASMYLGNGYLKNHQELSQYLKEAQRYSQYAKYFSPQAVLNLFTYNRSQTSLENDTAIENTLRQSRVLKKGLEFEFDCRIPENLLAPFEKIAKMVKSMGLNRSRGLGEIQLSIGSPEQIPEPATAKVSNLSQDDIANLNLDIHNQSPLLVSVESGKDQETQSYLPGSVILGACATLYIKQKRKDRVDYDPDQDEEFKALFVDGSVSWGNASLFYGSKISRLVPLSWKKDKKTEDIYNLALSSTKEKADENAANLKGLGNQYYVESGDSYCLCSPNLRVEYHHKRPQDKSKGSPDKHDGEFYQFEVIEENQHFRAQIRGEKAKLEKIQALLTDGEIWLGKSRSAQYAYCSVSTSFSGIDDRLEIENGDVLYLCLLSDTIIKNENGHSVANIDDIREEFVALWNRQMESKISPEILEPRTEMSFIATKSLGGFMNIWKLPKIQELAISAGSIIAFEYKGNNVDIGSLCKYQLGCETQRGCGRFSLTLEPEEDIRLISIAPESKQLPETPSDLIPIITQTIADNLKIKAIKESIKGFKSSQPSASLIKRIQAAVDSGAQATQNKAAKVLENIGSIKRLPSKRPAWIEHLENILKAEELPQDFENLFYNSFPEPDRDYVNSWFNIDPESPDSWFILIEQYCRHYLRNMALSHRKSKSNPNKEVQNEKA